MESFNFWQKWLFFVGIYFSLFGLVLVFFSDSKLMDFLFNNQINPVFWNAEEIPKNSARFQAWIYGVLGATLSSWGIFLTFLACYPFKAKEKWVWNCITTGLVIWFVADTYISVFYQVTFNVIFNLMVLFLVGLPLMFTRKSFSKFSTQDPREIT